LRALQRYSLLIILFIIRFPSWCDQLYDASLFEREGKVNSAIRLYESWLSENQSDPGFSDILFHCSSIISSTADSLEFLLKYEDDMQIEKKQDYYLRIAKIYELNFQKEEAARYYGKASINKAGNLNYEIYLKQLFLNYQMGDVPELTVLNNILLSNISSSVYVDALILKAEILKYRGDLRRAEMILQQSDYKLIHPEIHLALWEIYILENNNSAIADLLDFMKKEFPDSIELSIMKGEIGKLPRLSDFFINNESSEDKSYIQVGTFSNSENLRNQSQLLKSNGFDFFYVTKENLTKIIVVDTMSSEQLLNNLRSKGISGFRIQYP